MKVSVVKEEPMVKVKPADARGVSSKSAVKRKMDNQPTMLRPVDMQYMPLPCKQKPVEEQLAGGRFVSMEEAVVKEELLGGEDVDSASAVKRELDIGPTVLQPVDGLFVPRPYKLEPVEEQPAGSVSMEEPVIKEELLGGEDVGSVSAVKRELDIGPTVLQPIDVLLVPRPYKLEPVEEQPAGTFVSTEVLMVKEDPVDGEDVDSASVVERELDIGPTVLQPVDGLFVPRPYKLEPVEEQTAGSVSTEAPMVKEEPVDSEDVDSASAVERALDVGPTVLQPVLYVQRPYKLERVELPEGNTGNGISEVCWAPAEPGTNAHLLQENSTTDAQAWVASLFAGPSSEAAVWAEPTDPEEPKASFLVKALTVAPEVPHSGSELDSESDDDQVDEAPDRFAPAIGDLELVEDLLDDTNIVLAVADRVMNNIHESLPGVNTGFEWSEDYSTFRGKRETFTGGPSERAVVYDTPYDAFIAIWDESIMVRIATETNRYAQQTIDEMVEREALTSRARLNEWVETNVYELYVLFGLYIMMGYSPRLRLADYWSTNHYLNMPGFRETMSYNRYILLNKFLHFISNEDLGSRNDTKLAKLQPIIDHCYAKFESLYELGEHISINETLTLINGRPSWAQCRETEDRFGIKSFELCDSRTGYVWRFVIYTAKNSTHSYRVPVREIAGKATEIVLQLLEGLEGKGYYVTMDRFYNSPLLARYLKSRGFDCVGTLRPNRKNVPDAIKIKQSSAAGTIAARHSGDLSVLAWKDSTVVTTISTFHDARTYSCTKTGKTKPVVVRDYNEYMGGVDLKDRKLSAILLERNRCVKWYMKMFKRLFNVSVHNSYVLHRRTLERRGQATMSHKDFCTALAESLATRHGTNVCRVNQPRFTGKRLQKDVMHYPDRSTRRRCARCSTLGIPKKVHMICVTCNVGLCLGRCFKEYHTVPELSVKK